MTIQTQLNALLKNATDAAERVYPIVAPDIVIRPYITFQRISANSENVLSGASGLTNTRMQIDVFATTYAQAQTIAAQVDALISASGMQAVSIMSVDLYEQDVKLHRVQSDYSFWH